MPRSPRTRWLSSTIVLLSVAALLVGPLSDAATARPGAGSPASVSLSSTWAFEGSQAVDQSTRVGNLTVTETGSFAWATSLSEQSTGPWTFALQVQRGMVANFAQQVCTPSCSAPTYELSTTLTASEWTVAGLNLTAAASAQVATGAAAAVGLLNASVRSSDHLSTLSTVVSSGAPSASESRVLASVGTYAVAFGGGLPVFPTLGLTASPWTGSSAVTASGSYVRSIDLQFTGDPLPNAQATVTRALPSTSLLTITGSANSTRTLTGGESVQAFDLQTGGAFGLLDGLVPTFYAAGLFSASSSSGYTGLSENGTELDLDPSVTGHLALPASTVWFHPYAAPAAGAPAAPTFLTSASWASPTWAVQAHPESPSAAAAQFGAWGLTAGVPASTPLLVPGLSLATGLSPLFLVGLASASAIVVALGVRWRSRTGEPEAVPADLAAPIRSSSYPERPEPATPATGPRDPFDDLL